MESSAIEKKDYLDSLRGVAALSVALFHFNIGSIFNNSFTNNAGLMVDFFFVLSGYVISLNYNNRIGSFSDLFKFQRKRFARLYPLHFIILLSFVLLELLKLLISDFTNSISTKSFTGQYNPEYIYANLALAQNFFNSQLSWNAPSWSISAEFYTYFLWGLLFLIPHRSLRIFVLLLIFIITIYAYFTGYWGFGRTENGYLRCIFSFLIGSFLPAMETGRKHPFSGVATSVILISVVVILCYAPHIPRPLVIIFPFMFAALVYVLNQTDPKSRVIRILQNRHLVFIGTISYGIYMIHWLLWRIIGIIAVFIFRVPVVEGADGQLGLLLGLNSLQLAAFHIFSIALLIFLAALSYRFFEIPAKHLLMAPRSKIRAFSQS